MFRKLTCPKNPSIARDLMRLFTPRPGLRAATCLSQPCRKASRKDSCFYLLNFLEEERNNHPRGPELYLAYLHLAITNCKIFLGVLLWFRLVGERYNTKVILIICVNKVSLPDFIVMNEVIDKLHFSHSRDLKIRV